MTSAGPAPLIVTPSRAVDRPGLAALAESVRTALSATIPPGSPVGIWIEDPVDFGACATGALAAGAEAFVIAPGTSLTRALDLCAIEGGTVILCDAPRAAQIADGRRRECAPGIVLVEPPPSESAGGGERALDENDQGTLHFYTSGTDGRPKGVVRTRRALELEASTVGAHLGMTPGGTVLCAVQPSHAYGYAAGFFAPMSMGGTSLVASPRMPASLAKLLAEHEPDVVVAVPSQYSAWSALREPYSGPLPRLWLCGGAPLPQAVRDRFKAAWGSLIAEQYGMTECGAVSVDLDGAETLGHPYPGVTVFIDGGAGDGETGEVIVDAPYGALPSRGYIGDSAAESPRRFTPSGFRSGDSGWLDAEGRLHLVGRRAHQLNVHGRQVDPVEVERALWSVDGVRDVAVLGMDRPEGDQWVAAFVACAEDVDDDVLYKATAGLEVFKRPQRLIRLPTLPKNASGKTDLDVLRAIARSGVDA